MTTDIDWIEGHREAHTKRAIAAVSLPMARVLLAVIYPPCVREWPALYEIVQGAVAPVTRAVAVKSQYDVVALFDAKCRLTLEPRLADCMASPQCDIHPESHAELF